MSQNSHAGTLSFCIACLRARHFNAYLFRKLFLKPSDDVASDFKETFGEVSRICYKFSTSLPVAALLPTFG